MLEIFIYILIIILTILAAWYIVEINNSLSKLIEGCSLRNINDHDCRTIRIVRDYLIWLNILLLVTFIGSFIFIFLALYYRTNYTTIYNGWVVYGITLFLALITTGAYFLGLWSFEILSTVMNRDEVEREYNNTLVATSIVILINAILFMANIIFSRWYILRSTS